MTPVILRIVFGILFGRRAQWPRWLKFRPPGMHMASGGPPSILSRGEHFLPLFTAWVKNSRLNPKCSFFVLFCPFFSGQASTNKKGQKRTPCRKIKCESTTTENTRSHKAKKLGAIRGHVGAILHLVDATWRLLGPIWGSVGTKSQYSDVMGTENKKKHGCLFLLGTLRSGCLCLSSLH